VDERGNFREDNFTKMRAVSCADGVVAFFNRHFVAFPGLAGELPLHCMTGTQAK
jgi:hypothetical protein